jgi:hypothetical protein
MSSVDMLPAVVPLALAAPLPLSSALVLPELLVLAPLPELPELPAVDVIGCGPLVKLDDRHVAAAARASAQGRRLARRSDAGASSRDPTPARTGRPPRVQSRAAMRPAISSSDRPCSRIATMKRAWSSTCAGKRLNIPPG